MAKANNEGRELLADKLIREAAEKEAAKSGKEVNEDFGITKEAKKEAKASTENAAKKTAKKEVSDDVAEFFKQYPDAPSVLKVGDCLYLSIHKGGAREYARRMELEVEEITNPL